MKPIARLFLCLLAGTLLLGCVPKESSASLSSQESDPSSASSSSEPAPATSSSSSIEETESLWGPDFQAFFDEHMNGNELPYIDIRWEQATFRGSRPSSTLFFKVMNWTASVEGISSSRFEDYLVILDEAGELYLFENSSMSFSQGMAVIDFPDGTAAALVLTFSADGTDVATGEPVGTVQASCLYGEHPGEWKSEKMTEAFANYGLAGYPLPDLSSLDGARLLVAGYNSQYGSYVLQLVALGADEEAVSAEVAALPEDLPCKISKGFQSIPGAVMLNLVIGPDYHEEYPAENVASLLETVGDEGGVPASLELPFVTGYAPYPYFDPYTGSLNAQLLLSLDQEALQDPDSGNLFLASLEENGLVTLGIIGYTMAYDWDGRTVLLSSEMDQEGLTYMRISLTFPNAAWDTMKLTFEDFAGPLPDLLGDRTEHAEYQTLTFEDHESRILTVLLEEEGSAGYADWVRGLLLGDGWEGDGEALSKGDVSVTIEVEGRIAEIAFSRLTAEEGPGSTLHEAMPQLGLDASFLGTEEDLSHISAFVEDGTIWTDLDLYRYIDETFSKGGDRYFAPDGSYYVGRFEGSNAWNRIVPTKGGHAATAFPLEDIEGYLLDRGIEPREIPEPEDIYGEVVFDFDPAEGALYVYCDDFYPYDYIRQLLQLMADAYLEPWDDPESHRVYSEASVYVGGDKKNAAYDAESGLLVAWEEISVPQEDQGAGVIYFDRDFSLEREMAGSDIEAGLREIGFIGDMPDFGKYLSYGGEFVLSDDFGDRYIEFGWVPGVSEPLSEEAIHALFPDARWSEIEQGYVVDEGNFVFTFSDYRIYIRDADPLVRYEIPTEEIESWLQERGIAEEIPLPSLGENDALSFYAKEDALRMTFFFAEEEGKLVSYQTEYDALIASGFVEEGHFLAKGSLRVYLEQTQDGFYIEIFVA